MTVLFPAPRDPEPDEKGRGYFGVKMIDNSGVSISEVVPGSPADKGGLRVNDIVLAVDSNKVPSVAEAREVIARLRPGMTASVEVRRGERSVIVKVKVGVRPDNLP
jgi:S1-C subfamily serine protease